MRVGMYTPEMRRDTLPELLDAIVESGFETVQLDLKSVCGEELPAAFDDAQAKDLKRLLRERNLTVAALNGTFNMCTHAQDERDRNIACLRTLARAAVCLETPLVTMCSGSKNPGYEKRWRYHPDNRTPEAWEDTLWSARKSAEVAKEFDLTLGIEIEAPLVVGTAEDALKLFEQVGTNADRFGIIFDAANLFGDGVQTLESVHSLIESSMKSLADRIVLAHGKDICYGEGITFAGCGLGMLDYDFYLSCLKKIGYSGPMIIHGIKKEEHFPYCSNFMRQKIKLSGIENAAGA